MVLAISSEIIEKKDSYPKIMAYDVLESKCCALILMVRERCGTCIYSGGYSLCTFGEFRTDWPDKNLKLYTGEIKLSNVL